MSQLNREKKLAVAISREHVRNSRLKLETYCFQNTEDIHHYELNFLVGKSFLYMNELNEFIWMAGATGLIEKWHTDKRIRYRKNNNNEIQSISNYSLTGVYIVLFNLVVFVFLMVYCERLIHKKVRQPNPKRFWLIAEMIIDPNRHFWLDTILINGHLVF